MHGALNCLWRWLLKIKTKTFLPKAPSYFFGRYSSKLCTVALVWLKVVWLELDHPKIACEWRISLAERSIFVCLASWSSFVLDKVLYVKHLNFISDKELKKVMCPGKYLWKSRRRKRNYDRPNDFGLVIRPLSSYALRKLAALSPLSWKSDSC